MTKNKRKHPKVYRVLQGPSSHIKQDFHLILASNSSIRKKILSDLSLEFEAAKPLFDEEKAKEKIRHLSIKEQALYLARNKALSISAKYPDSIVIASDQICQIGNKIISKSNDKNEAILQLSKMNGKIHYQNNAVCLYQGRKKLFEHFERAKLKMRKLSASEIKSYVISDESWGSAGSYKFESLGRYLFSDVSGNYDCILGMAMQKVINFLCSKNYIKLI